MPELCRHTFRPWRVQGDTRVVAAESTWKEPLKWDRAAKAVGERHRVFCASLADVFEHWQGPMTDSRGDIHLTTIAGFYPRPTVMQDVRVRLLKLIIQTQNLDYLLLTKRPSNALPMLQDAWMQMDSARDPDPRNSRPFELPRNVWLGASVENQQAADERIPHLLKVPAAVRFLSCEPLLGPIKLPFRYGDDPYHSDYGQSLIRQHIHWVIVGGESGPGARPCRVEWIRSIVRQCKAAGVPCFVKQLGTAPQMTWREYCNWHPTPPAVDCHPSTIETIRLRDRKGGDIAEFPSDLQIREFPEVRA